MNQNNKILSSAMLKDKAKEALSGNYFQLILVMLVVYIIDFALVLLISIVENLLFNLLKQGMLLMLQGDAFSYFRLQPEIQYVLAYIFDCIEEIFSVVLEIGARLCFLNVACGRKCNVSDVFHGFSYQPGKSFQIAFIYMLLRQLYHLPKEILRFMILKDAAFPLICVMMMIFFIGSAVAFIMYFSVSQTLFLLLDFPGYSAGELFKMSIRIMEGHKGRFLYIQTSFLPLLMLNVLTLNIGSLWLTPYITMTDVFFFLNLMQAREKQA